VHIIILTQYYSSFSWLFHVTVLIFYSFRVYYAFVTYTDATEAEQAIKHGNDDKTQVQLDIRYGERKQTQTPYYDLGCFVE